MVLIAAHVVHAGDRSESAFGFSKGMTLKQVRAVAPIQKLPNGFATKAPPKPVYPFVVYSILLGETTGVCGVIAHTDHQPDGSKAYKDMSQNVLTMLMNKYGSPTHTGETETSRTLMWADAQGPNTSVKLTVHHADDGTAYIELAYAFSNLRICSKELMQGL